MTITVTTTGETHRMDYLRAAFSLETSVTEHPVEIGAEVSDHIQRRPLRFTTEVRVTDSPRAASLVTLRTVALATSFFERAVGELCTVVLDGEGTFLSYVLEAASYDKSPAAARTFDLRWKRIRIASALSVTIPPRLPAPAAQVGMPSEAPLGQQATTVVATPAAEALLHSAMSAFLPSVY